jgi:ATP/maltotriose-dependent transcriptional regulator MalT/DNA-binding XRE family transcriptional regulator
MADHWAIVGTAGGQSAERMSMGRHPSRKHTSPEETPTGTRIRQRRRDLDLTQSDLAGPDYTKSFISQVEGGHADPSLDTLRFFGRRLHLSLSSIAGDDADRRLAVLAGLLEWAESRAEVGRLDAARRVAELVREIASESAEPLFEADALLALARLDTAAGNLDAAQRALDAVAALPLRPGSRVTVRAALAQGELALRRGDEAASIEAFRRVARWDPHSARHADLRAQALVGLAAAADRSGNRKQARQRLQSALAVAARHRQQGLCGDIHVRLAVLEHLEARPDAALQHLQDAGQMLLTNPRARVAALVALAQAALASGDLSLANQAAHDACRLAEIIDEEVLRARTGAVTARVLAGQGRHAEGAARLSEAASLICGEAAPVEVVQAAKEFWEFYQALGDRDAAARFLAVTARPTLPTTADGSTPGITRLW